MLHRLLPVMSCHAACRILKFMNKVQNFPHLQSFATTPGVSGRTDGENTFEFCLCHILVGAAVNAGDPRCSRHIILVYGLKEHAGSNFSVSPQV